MYEVAFVQPIPRLSPILSTNLQLSLTLFQHVKYRATMLHGLRFFRDIDKLLFTSVLNKICGNILKYMNYNSNERIDCKLC